MRLAVLGLLFSGVSSCAGGGGGLAALSVVRFNFAPGFAGVRINSPLEITFTAPIDINTITQDSVRIFTTTTTTEQPDPGAPAIFDFPPLVIANVLILKPRIPQNRDLSDSGLRIGFTYTIQVPASPDVIEPIRTTQGDPNLISFIEFFTTINSTVLPAPGDNLAEPNLASLPLFFVDEFGIDPDTGVILSGGIGFGVDPCPRATLPMVDRDSPQVIDTDPNEGEAGFGTITGIQSGLGTAFVRLDPITIEFSEPIGPWRIRAADIVIENKNTPGEFYDLFFFFTQDRTHSRLQITVFDADSAFDQASVPQGTYELRLRNFVDLAGNNLIESSDPDCPATGRFSLLFSTVSSPALPTDFTITFGDDDGEGHVDVGGLPTGISDPNVLPEFMSPFVGGFSVDHVAAPAGQTTSSANWGDTGLWTGCEVFYSNGYDPATGDDLNIGTQLRLRGGVNTAATAIMAPIAGRATGPGSGGTTNGSRPADQRPPELGGPGDPAKTDFFAQGATTISLFTGTVDTGPVVYHYARFDLLANAAGTRATLTYRKIDPDASGPLTERDDSIFPMIIFVEQEAVITGQVLLDGGDGELGFNGNTGLTFSRAPGGPGGLAGAGGGSGGDGGVTTLDASDPEFLNGQTGDVPANVLGPLDSLSEAMAGLSGLAPGGGGHYNDNEDENNDPMAGPIFVPAYQGGGGASQGSNGTSGSDINTGTPGGEFGVGGQRFGSDVAGMERPFQPPALCTGGAGGGGGGADDDGLGGGDTFDDDGFANASDDGGGGGGAGGGFFGLACAGNVTLGAIIPPMMPGDPQTVQLATIRCVGGRGGSTYAFVVGDPPVPADWTDANMDQIPQQGELAAGTVSSAVGQGEAGGGGGGGNVCIISGDQITAVAVEIYVAGKQGGNSPDLEGGVGSFRDQDDMGSPLSLNIKGGDGGGGNVVLLDSDGLAPGELPGEGAGGNPLFFIEPDPLRDLDGDGDPDLVTAGPDGEFGTDDDVPVDAAAAAILRDFEEFSGFGFLVPDVYGDDPREPLFGETRIVSAFFDTLTDFGSYNEYRTLSNAPRFEPDTITLYLDATQAGAGGLPDLSTELPDGMLTPPVGGTYQASLTRNPFPPVGPLDPELGAETGVTQWESRDVGVGDNDDVRLKRFARVRIIFDLATVLDSPLVVSDFATAEQLLLGQPTPDPGPDGVLGDDPNTPLVVANVGDATTSPPTATVFDGVNGLSSVNDFYNGQTLRFNSGALEGETQTVTGYVGMTQTFTVGAAFSQAPAVGDEFEVGVNESRDDSTFPPIPELEFASPTSNFLDIADDGDGLRGDPNAGTVDATNNAPTASQFDAVGAALATTDDAYNGGALTFTSGANTGFTVTITDYVGSPAAFTVDPGSVQPPGSPWVAPGGGDTFEVRKPGLDNTLNNRDQARAGVPAVAELRVRFTPAGNPNPGG